jgi:hypothetical protein
MIWPLPEICSLEKCVFKQQPALGGLPENWTMICYFRPLSKTELRQEHNLRLGLCLGLFRLQKQNFINQMTYTQQILIPHRYGSWKFKINIPANLTCGEDHSLVTDGTFSLCPHIVDRTPVFSVPDKSTNPIQDLTTSPKPQLLIPPHWRLDFHLRILGTHWDHSSTWIYFRWYKEICANSHHCHAKCQVNNSTLAHTSTPLNFLPHH